MLKCFLLCLVGVTVLQDCFAQNAIEKGNELLDKALAFDLKPGSEPADMDSALLLIALANKINEHLNDKHLAAKSLFVASKVWHDKGDTIKANQTIVRSIGLYNQLPFIEESGDAYWQQYGYLADQATEEIKCRRAACDKVLLLYRAAGSKRKQAAVVKEMADNDQMLGNFGLALNEAKQSLALSMASGDQQLQGIYDLLGAIAESMGDFPAAFDYGLKAVQTAIRQQDTTMQLCTIYMRLGITLSIWGKQDEACGYMKKALAIALRCNDNFAIGYTMQNLSTCLVRASRFRECLEAIHTAEKQFRLNNIADSLSLAIWYSSAYVYRKQFDGAGRYIRVLLKLLPRIDKEDTELSLVYPLLVRYYIGTQQYANAKKMSGTYLNGLGKNSFWNVALSAYLCRFMADSALGNYQEALHSYQKYKEMNDSVTTANKAFQVAQLQVAYETEQKDNDIRIKQQDIQLLKTSNELEQVSYNRKSSVRNILIAMTLAFALIIYMAYRSKQRHNAKLQTQQRQIKKQNESLEDALEQKNNLLVEKEWLVKEIHHRVKNNLQVVISLLNIQSNMLRNKEAIAAIAESKQRMQAISIIHQNLYRADNTTTIEMESYLPELVESIRDCFSNIHLVHFKLAIENIHLDITQAMPLGLAINEAVTNAMKYAFDDKQSGEIEIVLREFADHIILLTIKDTGRGLPENFDITQTNSMGMTLMNVLTRQIGGTLSFRNDHGLTITIEFSKDMVIANAQKKRSFHPNK